MGIARRVSLGLSLGLAFAASTILAAPPGDGSLDETLTQRKQFQAAEQALQQGRINDFRTLVRQLADYPLQPYLEYSELRRRLYLFPADDVESFLSTHAGTYLGDLLAREWLETLAKNRRWKDYQRYFETANLNHSELRCYYLRARYNTGEKSVLDEVTELWNVGHSQPDACDPLFKVWMDRGYLTGDIAWQRHSKAIAERNLSLSRYVAGKMPEDMRKLADLYYEVDRHPDRLKDHQRFRSDSAPMHEIILHGIRRWAIKDSLAALREWEVYDGRHLFPPEDRRHTQEHLITYLAVDGHMEAAQGLLEHTEEISSSELIAWLVRDALRSEDWQRAYDSIQLFPPREQQDERWLYWQARAMEKLEIRDEQGRSAQQIYAALALTRSYYGFLAADILGREYTLLDRPVDPPPESMALMRENPAIQRAKELWDLGRTLQARREWFYATRGLEAAELLAAGKLAEQWGWYRKSIQAMIEARYWDDLQLRFPLAYQEEMISASAGTNVEPTLLFAIARQESAFAADARSPAGAMGVMQLLPATAKRTARSIGVTYRYWDLINPTQNIQLGSRYLNQLLDQFNGNRILAAAAYNAGPHRVMTWLENNGRQLPYDIWIETIPYRETRGYVQNVLSYSVIYGYRMGKQLPMLRDSEMGGISLLGIAEEAAK